MVKNLPAMQETQVQSVGQERFPGEGNGLFLPGEFHRQRSLAGYSPWDCRDRPTELITQHEGKVESPVYSVITAIESFSWASLMAQW